MSLADIRLRAPKAAFAIARTLPLEGGLADVAGDSGGMTKGGVWVRYALAEIRAHPDMIRMFDVDHDGHVDRKDILGLTDDEKADIFYQCWWLTGWYANLTPDLVAWKCFDIAVNTGPKRAGFILQKALGDCGANLSVDAVVGPRTVMSVAAQAANDNGVKLIAAIRREQADFYRRLVGLEPGLTKFRAGWLNG